MKSVVNLFRHGLIVHLIAFFFLANVVRAKAQNGVSDDDHQMDEASEAQMLRDSLRDAKPEYWDLNIKLGEHGASVSKGIDIIASIKNLGPGTHILVEQKSVIRQYDFVWTGPQPIARYKKTRYIPIRGEANFAKTFLEGGIWPRTIGLPYLYQLTPGVTYKLQLKRYCTGTSSVVPGIGYALEQTAMDLYILSNPLTFLAEP